MSLNKSFSSETSGRYARALFELAQESAQLETIEDNIKNMLKILKSNLDFKNYINDPTKSIYEQSEIINKISNIMNFSKIFKDFLSVIVLKRRIFYLHKIILSFLKLSSEKRGEVSAKLISSKALSAEELKKISSELSNIINTEINFDYRVDKNLIGGFKMQIGSLMVDTSIKNKLKNYEQQMLEN